MSEMGLPVTPAPKDTPANRVHAAKVVAEFNAEWLKSHSVVQRDGDKVTLCIDDTGMGKALTERLAAVTWPDGTV